MLEVIPYVRALLYQSHSEVGNAKQVRSFLIRHVRRNCCSIWALVWGFWFPNWSRSTSPEGRKKAAMPYYNKDPGIKHFFKSFAERLLLGVRGCSWSHLTRKSSVSPSASSFLSKATTIRDPLTVGVSRLACTRTPQHATWIQVRNKTNRRT
jgi:hypothetical protein